MRRSNTACHALRPHLEMRLNVDQTNSSGDYMPASSRHSGVEDEFFFFFSFLLTYLNSPQDHLHFCRKSNDLARHCMKVILSKLSYCRELSYARVHVCVCVCVRV